MVDYVYQVDTLDTLVGLAKTMQFYDEKSEQSITQVYDEKSEHIITHGPLPEDGEWFLVLPERVFNPTGKMVTDAMGNKVPEMAAEPGLWGRLRLNGTSTFIESLRAVVMATHAGLTVYEQAPIGENGEMVWTSDGKTPAPAWVSNVAQIA